MILQALCRYYERRNQHPDRARHLPRFGFEEREVPYVLELAADGTLKAITVTGQREGKKLVGQRYPVPMGVKKTSGIAANLLWDNAEYVLALPDAKKLDAAKEKSAAKAEDYLARLADMQAAFAQRIARLPPSALADAGVQAVLAFLNTDTVAALRRFPQEAAEIAASNPVLSFRLLGELDLVCESPAVRAAVVPEPSADDETTPPAAGTTAPTACLITGEVGEVERLHTAIKGVWGAQMAGANIVSFNAAAYQSHGKEQGANAPVSPAAAFAYTTALNALLAKDSRQRMQVGDASTVFWAEAEAEPLEEAFGLIFGAHTDDPNAHTDAVRALYASLHSGAFMADRGEKRFYVLGLAPNAARLSVRFWHCDTTEKIAQKIAKWFKDTQVSSSDQESNFLTIRSILASACLPTRERPNGDLERLPANIAGDLMRSILRGGQIPALLLKSIILRCRAEQSRKDPKTGKAVRHVSHPRAALIRAAINRYLDIHQPNTRRINVSLDENQTAPPYLLGRLFAAYEKTQEDAADRDLNKTIRDAYFGAAMSTPGSVFPRLMRLNQFHLRDLKRSRKERGKFLDSVILRINEKLDAKAGFPKMLDLHEQGFFALGYYHQRQAFFTKTPAAAESTEAASDATETPAA